MYNSYYVQRRTRGTARHQRGHMTRPGADEITAAYPAGMSTPLVSKFFNEATTEETAAMIRADAGGSRHQPTSSKHKE